MHKYVSCYCLTSPPSAEFSSPPTLEVAQLRHQGILYRDRRNCVPYVGFATLGGDIFRVSKWGGEVKMVLCCAQFIFGVSSSLCYNGVRHASVVVFSKHDH